RHLLRAVPYLLPKRRAHRALRRRVRKGHASRSAPRARTEGGLMKALVLDATWDPRPDYALSAVETQTRKALIGSSVWRHPRADFRQVADPTPGPDDVIVRVRRVGFCGSDLHFFETGEAGSIRYPGLTRFPTILGHELAGEAVMVGKSVGHIRVGDPVTIEDMVRCGVCYPCRTGQPNQCENLDEIGFSLDGGF